MAPVIKAGTHDAALVALSILIAIMASYTALDLAARIRASRKFARQAWLLTAAVAMGGGIWSMHFVAMLAFSIPGMETHYDLSLTVLSLIVPIIVTGVGFYLIGRADAGLVSLGFSGFVMGMGIVAMHYIGMAAMRMPADLRYEKLWVAVSILIALGASTVALWLAFKNTGLRERLIASMFMGLAISGMHYSAMQGAVFSAHAPVDHAQGHASVGQLHLALAVAGASFLIFFLALIAAMFDRRFSVLAEREALALRESEERFRALYRRTPVPLHSLNPSGLIEQVSDAWLELLAYSRSEVIDRPITDFMTPDSAERWTEVDWPELASKGILREVEYQFATKSGSVLDVLLTSNVEWGPGGDFGRSLGGLIDVTAHKQAENALRQSQKMDAIGQLTGGIAHDFNNLLAVIIAHLELLDARLPNNLDLKQLISNAMQGAKRGTALTKRMLTFARQHPLKPEAVEVPALVRGMTELLQRSIGPSVRIETQFPSSVRRALVDANQLELAILNLAVNARDAMPNGGSIQIAADEISPEAGAAPTFIRISVTDSGEGMDELTLAKAADPFFTTKAVGQGTGLGLSMVHGLAEQSGGKLVLRSRKGHGATAEIWLPVSEIDSDVSKGARRETGSHAAERRNLNVLAVDDDALVLAGTAATLESLGHEVSQVTSGREALDVLDADGPFDLVITDQGMPGMTGVQLAQEVRAKQPEMPIILATGYADLPLGTDPALIKLSKPFFADTLAAAIARVTSGRADLRNHTT